jgi:hypothetical protein
MMENQELFKQAILDAKAVRETAMAAAKATLAEHFEPFVKESMAKTLSEDDMADMEESDKMEEMKHDMEKKKHKMEEMSDMVDESTLDEILAELDALSEEMDGNIDEAKKQGTTAGYSEKAHTVSGDTGYDEKARTTKGGTGYPEKAKSSIHEADDEESDNDEDESAEDDKPASKAPKADEPVSDATEVVELEVGDLKEIIRDVFMQLQSGAGDMGPALDADTDLAADLGGDEMEVDDEEEISLEEILAELENEEKKMEEAAKVPGSIKTDAEEVHQVEEMKKELNEAVRTIKALKSELNEVNLFSAKMLYVNKIFKAKNLSEAQKKKVIDAFDRNVSVKEVENTYKTLLESLGSETKKGSLRESVGFASKPIGHAPARPIVEADSFVTRWQQLAGIR